MRRICCFLLLFIIAGCQRESGTEPIDDGLPPSPPGRVNIYYSSDGAVGIEWNVNPEPDVVAYQISRSTNISRLSVIDTTSNLYFIDKYLDYDSTYYYYIKAIDGSGMLSASSAVVIAKPVNRYRPFTPNSISISARNRLPNNEIVLSWDPGTEYDIKGYKIYRSEMERFSPDSLSYLAFTPDYIFVDSANLELLTTYYYKLIRVDNGELESDPSAELSDLIFDNPVNIFPPDNSRLDYFEFFRIRTVGAAANYKLVISESEIGGEIANVDLYSSGNNEIIEIPVGKYSLSPFKIYYWQVFSYSADPTVPNSYSGKSTFIIETDGSF